MSAPLPRPETHVPLDEDEQDDGGQHGQHAGRHERAHELHRAALAEERPQPHLQHRLLALVEQGAGPDEVVPDLQEHHADDGQDPSPRDGQEHAEEGSEVGAAVDVGGLLELLGAAVLEVAVEHEDREGEHEADVGQDHPGVGVDQVQTLGHRSAQDRDASGAELRHGVECRGHEVLRHDAVLHEATQPGEGLAHLRGVEVG
nr:hypothetical protein [Georgenia yuyongxinii]